MSAADPVRAKALACLREARVTVMAVKLSAEWRPVLVMARVKSSRDNVRPYRVRFSAGQWTCTCDSRVSDGACPHIHAVSLVTTAAA
jgi:hypothetical protein